MELNRHDIASFDGVRLAVHTAGAGRPVMLLHGLFSNAHTNWVRFGAAERIVAAGWRLILPDLRGHGESEAPADPASWPEDVLARDAEAVAETLGLGPDLVLGGYSLGARTTVRVLVRGRLQPRAAILSGMGLEGITGGEARGAWFVRMIEGRGTWQRNTPEWIAESFMMANVAQPDALVHLLRGQKSTPADLLAGLQLPVAVVCGTDDRDNGSAEALAAALARARLVAIPGNHMSAVTRPDFGTSLADALAWL
ncbi:MAG: alpha/beta fold hydrolase [Sphingomonadaceae bacterium]